MRAARMELGNAVHRPLRTVIVELGHASVVVVHWRSLWGGGRQQAWSMVVQRPRFVHPRTAQRLPTVLELRNTK